MIGNSVDAALAATLPNQFFIGSGNTRDVFCINGVVYKVNMSDSFDYNELEFNTACGMQDILPEGVRIPDMTLYDGNVLACEYIDGTLMGDCIDTFVGLPCSTPEACISDELSNELCNIGFMDQSYGNIIGTNEGIIYLVDLG